MTATPGVIQPNGWSDTQAAVCTHCGETAHLEVFEIFDDRTFILDACCTAAHEEAVETLQDPLAGARLLQRLGLDEMLGGRLRRVCDIGCSLQLDWQLQLVPITLRTAQRFVDAHHDHCPPPVGWRFGQGVRNGSDLIGVVTVGRPVARGLDKNTTVEINRVCVRRDFAAEFRWNAASMLYGWAAREATRRGFQRCVTYLLEHEPGTSLIAAGFVFDGMTRGGAWSCASRPREDNGPRGRKQRWILNLAQRGRRRGSKPQHAHAAHLSPARRLAG